MIRVVADVSALGISDEDLATAGRVAMAIHDQITATMRADPRRRGKASVYALAGTANTLLEIGGWRSQKQRGRAWLVWLCDRGRCTVQEAHDARVACGLSTAKYRPHDGERAATCARLRELALDGVIRYVSADKGDPGVVVWIGDRP